MLTIVLHWAIVAGLLFMFASGLYMVNGDLSKADQYRLFQIHKASGVIMLWAIIVRIAVRVLTQSPQHIQGLNVRQNKLSKFGHVIIYLALITMPLSGWFMVSASPFGVPTLVFVDWLNWPHVPGVARNKSIETIANNTHWITAILLGLLIVGHISAVVWHKKKHKINLMNRILWGKK